MFYLAPFENKYDNFYELLVNENVPLGNFHDYQKPVIAHLVQEGYLYTDTHGFVKIKNNVLLFLIRRLHQNEVINYWHYSEGIRKEIDRLVVEFTTGLDLRNKYLHGTNSAAEKQHKTEYYILLRLIILVLLKIDDDLILRKRANQHTIIC